MKKLKIIYRSGTQTTVDYDENKCDLFKEILNKLTRYAENFNQGNGCMVLCDEATDKGKVLVQVGEIDHLEVL